LAQVWLRESKEVSFSRVVSETVLAAQPPGVFEMQKQYAASPQAVAQSQSPRFAQVSPTNAAQRVRVGNTVGASPTIAPNSPQVKKVFLQSGSTSPTARGDGFAAPAAAAAPPQAARQVSLAGSSPKGLQVSAPSVSSMASASPALQQSSSSVTSFGMPQGERQGVKVIHLNSLEDLPASIVNGAAASSQPGRVRPAAPRKMHTLSALPESPTSSPLKEGGVARHRLGFTDDVLDLKAHDALQVSVIAPGGGTGINKAVYTNLQTHAGFHVDIKGKSRAPYDKYPPGWPTGGPPPNLETFAQELLQEGAVEKAQCFVFGSRGGQVVLPAFWEAKSGAVPPAVVINGGIARDDLIKKCQWPDSAVTFLLIGGKDNFRQNKSLEDYLNMTLRHVPRRNMTTAVLYLDEMTHMPQLEMLDAILVHMLGAVVSWKPQSPTDLPQKTKDKFETIVKELSKRNWTGRLLHKMTEDTWNVVHFGPQGPSRGEPKRA